MITISTIILKEKKIQSNHFFKILSTLISIAMLILLESAYTVEYIQP